MPILPDSPIEKLKADAGREFRFTRFAAQGGIFEKMDAPRRFAWRGRNVGGAFETQAPVFGEKAADLWKEFGRSFIHSPMVLPVAVSQHFALIYNASDEKTELSLLHDNGRLELLGASKRLGVGAWLLPKGNLMVQLVHAGSDDLVDYLEVLAYDDQGQRTERRWFVGTAGSSAWGPSGPGLLEQDGDKLQYRPLSPGTVPIVITPQAHVDVCAKPSRPDVITYYGSSPDVFLDGAHAEPLIVPTRMDPGSTAAGIFETSSSGTCLRTVVVGTPYSLTVSAEKGILSGVLIGPAMNHEVTCRHVKNKK